MISNMVRGNSSLVLVVVVITSALVHFTLPALIKTVAAKEMMISFLPMLKMLATVIFIPIAIVELIRYLLPRLRCPDFKSSVSFIAFDVCLDQSGSFLSVCLFSERPLGDYHGGGGCFRACGCLLCGGHLFRKGPLENQLAGAVMLGNINNVLNVVFLQGFSAPLSRWSLPCI